MSWMQKTLKRRNLKLSRVETKRSEEISDIIDRMPMAFGRWVAIVVLALSLLLLFFGWAIKYPDTVTGQIKINSNNAPVKLVANISGKIHLYQHKAQEEVKAGDYIAVIQNPAKTEDVLQIISLVEIFDPNKKLTSNIINMFPEKVSLGDLNLKYYIFLSAIKNQYDYNNDNIFEKQAISLRDDIKWKESILKESQEILNISTQRLNISQKWFNKYKSLNKENIATYEYEVDQSLDEHLKTKQEVQNIKKEIASIQMQIIENWNRLNQLEVEQKERERILKLDILSSFHDLKGQIEAWEQKYIFKAPFNGRLEFLMFLVEDQFIQAGEQVFGIVPQETNIIGQVLLPSSGAGKVKMYSKVTVKLNDYPYTEYGSIDGYVSSISLITQLQKTQESQIDTYLITVELPDGLKTNYGETLNFKPNIGGIADIIVKERRLIERLFDNLKYNTK